MPVVTGAVTVETNVLMPYSTLDIGVIRTIAYSTRDVVCMTVLMVLEWVMTVVTVETPLGPVVTIATVSSLVETTGLVRVVATRVGVTDVTSVTVLLGTDEVIRVVRLSVVPELVETMTAVTSVLE